MVVNIHPAAITVCAAAHSALKLNECMLKYFTYFPIYVDTEIVSNTTLDWISK